MVEASTKDEGPSIEFEDRVVAFLDVLGWRNAIQASVSDPELRKKMGAALKFIEGVGKMADRFEENWGGKRFHEFGEYGQFSDSIVISMPAESGIFTLPRNVAFHGNAIMMSGLLVRGGITVGPLYHRGNIAFGPALTKAYDLQSELAIYPRIVVDPDLAALFLQAQQYTDTGGKPIGAFKIWRRADDGIYFLDILQPMGATTQFEAGSSSGMYLKQVRPIIERGLAENVGDPGVHGKYRWMADYFNDVAAECPKASIEPIQYR